MSKPPYKDWNLRHYSALIGLSDVFIFRSDYKIGTTHLDTILDSEGSMAEHLGWPGNGVPIRGVWTVNMWPK